MAIKKQKFAGEETKSQRPSHASAKASATENSYQAKDIYVLEGLEPVRKRPGMYIGSTGPDGLHHLIFEAADNCLDEFMAGYGNEMVISFLPNNRVEVKDNGRGIPVEKHPQTKKSALETVMCTLHAGAKFGGESYKIAGGLHGVGISVVNALSKWMRVEVCREKIKYAQEYSKGKPKTAVKKIGRCQQSGTAVTFEPDPEIFKEIKFDLKRVLNHLRQQAYLTKGVRITVLDEREKDKARYGFYFEGGLASYIKHLVRGVTTRHPNVFYCAGEFAERSSSHAQAKSRARDEQGSASASDKSSAKENIQVEAAFQYTEEFESYEEGFANNIHTGEGGTHLTGFRAAMTRTLNDYAKKQGFIKDKNGDNLSGDDVREGLTAVVSVKLREPQFEGQTKAKLGNLEAKVAVESVVSEQLADFLERNPQDARSIIEKCILSAKARKAAKAARETVLRKGVLEGLALPGKLADCVSRKPEESELYIVEGESAGGCFSGDTKVALVDGRNLTFKELVKENEKGKKNYCYTMGRDGKVGVALILNPRKTREKVKVMKIILDNNEEIICTPDHLFMLKDGSYEKAESLMPATSLMPLYRKRSSIKDGFKIDGYKVVYDQRMHKWVYAHHVVKETMARPDIQDKMRKIRQSKEYREKVRATMLKPTMRKMLSDRAKKQWEKNEEYKQYMTQKFREFYHRNKEYRERNNKLLNENQKRYWSNLKNRRKWAEKVKEYFVAHPEKREELSLKAKRQWEDKELLRWRSRTTINQWTPEFRLKRKQAYNQTYLEKALKLMREIFEEYGSFSKEEYNLARLERNDKSILRFDTICQRFFDNKEEKFKEAVVNYNHRIKKIIKLKERVDVYDLEVEGTHNFALASGVFVHNSSRQARNRHFQAILPLRGKILNVERARLDKMLSSKEIKALIIALGTAVAEDFDPDKARYHRIILTCDADTDGNHIRTLLLTLFYRYFKPLIERGYLYIAQPPLYKIQSGKEVKYIYTEDQKLSAQKSFGKKPVSIQRYKGLGEMNASELWDTTMDPKNRILLQVTIESAREADKIFDVLMGDEVLPRRKFIQQYAKKVKNLDI